MSDAFYGPGHACWDTIKCACGATIERSGHTPYDARRRAAGEALVGGWDLYGYGDETRWLCPSCAKEENAESGKEGPDA
jgi:hypothetical protein